MSRLADLLARSVTRFGPRPALVVGDETYAYDRLAGEVDRWAGALRSARIGGGDRVAALLHNGIEFVALLFATARLGAMFVPVNTRLKPAELRHVLLGSRADILIAALSARTQGDLAERVLAATPPGVRIVAVDSAPPLGMTPADDFLAAGQSTDATAEGEARVLVFTSGTTEAAKACVLTETALLGSARSASMCLRLGPDDRLWDPCPLFHLSGISPLLSALDSGATFLTTRHFEPGAAVDTIHRHGVTVAWPAFEAIALPLLDHASFGPVRTASVRAVFCVGSERTLQRVSAAFPEAVLLLGYGSTEAAGNACLTRVAAARPGMPERAVPSVEGVQLQIRDRATGGVLPAGEVGAVHLRGPNLFSGYLDFSVYREGDEISRDGFDEAGWFATGDLGRLDASGRFEYGGRAKDMLKVGGENVAALEIESCLATHPDVKVVAVVAAPDDRYGEIPAAFVELVAGSSITAESLQEFCAARLASFKVPRTISVVNEWPMSATKIDKSALRAQLAGPAGDRAR